MAKYDDDLRVRKFIFQFKENRDKAFFGEILNSCNIFSQTNKKPPVDAPADQIEKPKEKEHQFTAGIGLDRQNRLSLYINPDFFDSLSQEERIAVIEHEMMHVTHNHIPRFKKNNPTKNIAMDCAINQFIKNIPKDCVSLERFRKEVEPTAEPEMTAEYYYSLFKENPNQQKQYQLGAGGDEHFNDSELSEEEQQAVMNEIYDQVLKRCSEKHVSVPREFSNMVASYKKINWKQIFSNFITQQINNLSQNKTWTRKHKKYGFNCSVPKPEKKFNINFFIDTSGSIDDYTIAEFLKMYESIDRKYKGLLNFNYFHTSIYKTTKQFETINLDSGGTDLTDVSEAINKSTPNSVNIVFTDGHFSMPPMHKRSIYLLFAEGSTDQNIDRRHKIVTIN